MVRTFEWRGYTMTERPDGTFASKVEIGANFVVISATECAKNAWVAKIIIDGSNSHASSAASPIVALDLAWRRHFERAESALRLIELVGDGKQKKGLRKCIDCKHMAPIPPTETVGKCQLSFERVVSLTQLKRCNAFEAKP